MLYCCTTSRILHSSRFFFFNDTATTEIYTLSLHDALPIFSPASPPPESPARPLDRRSSLGVAAKTARTVSLNWRMLEKPAADRKSTRLNSSHANISYAVFCLKKKRVEKQGDLTATVEETTE